MSSFSTTLRLIPRPAWIVGCLLAVVLILPIALGPMRFDAGMHAWPPVAKLALVSLPPIFILAWALLVGFIYADAKRRGMRHVMWAWLAVVPYFIGAILYFILRDPLPAKCPRCGTDVPHTFAYCPGCGAAIHPVCAHCGKAMQWEWANCPHCGNRIAPGETA